MPFDEPEQTELIDVSAVSDVLPDEPSGTATRASSLTAVREPSLQAVTAPEVGALTGMRIAGMGERFVASCVDLIILWLGYWAAVGAYNRIFAGSWLGPAPVLGMRGAFFHGIFSLFVFLYYLVTEGIFLATPGKAVCRMSIRRKDGHLPSYTSIIVRNLLRPLDVVLGGLIALIFMETTEKRQRLGDFVGGTIVIKRESLRHAKRTITSATIGGTIGRLVAGLIDLVIVGALTAGLVLLINPGRPVANYWLILTIPLIVVFFGSIGTALTETSPGKWLLGYVISCEDGGRIGLSQSFLRTAFMPLDICIVGVLSIALSPKRQRTGDAVAGTVVHRHPRHWSGAVWCVVAMAAAAGTCYAGLGNRKNVFNQDDFVWSLLPRVDAYPEWPAVAKPPEPLSVENFRFAAGGPDTKRTPAIYLPGETAYFLFEVHGYKKDDRQVWLQQDLVVRYPDLTFGLRQENIIDYKQVVRGKGAIELINNVNLPLTAMPGKYGVFVTLRDRLANQQVVLQESFEVKGDSPPQQTEAETKEIEKTLASPAPSAPTPSAMAAPPAFPPAEPDSDAPKVMSAPSIPVPPLSPSTAMPSAEPAASVPPAIPGPTP